MAATIAPVVFALRTFLEGFVDVDLARGEVLVVLHVREDTPLVDPVVVMGTEEEDGEVSDVVAEALDVRGHQAGVADLRRPPPAGQGTGKRPNGEDHGGLRNFT